MKITASKLDLMGLLGRCLPATDPKGTMPILGSLLVSAKATGQVRVTATNLLMSVTGTITSEVAEDGSVSVPGRDLFERVKAMPDGPIIVEAKEDARSVVVRAKGTKRRFKLPSLSGQDFPEVSFPISTAPVITLPARAMADMFGRVRFAVSADESRSQMNCALLTISGGVVRLVATDGHRLCKVERCADGEAEMMIPLRSITALLKSLSGAGLDEDVAISLSGPSAFFTIGTVTMGTKLVDGDFPEYQRVIPDQGEHPIVVGRTGLAECIRAVMLIRDPNGGIKLTIEGTSIHLSAEGHAQGNGDDEIEVDYDGPPVKVGINGSYLIDVLGAIDDEAVSITAGGSLDPILVTPTTDDRYLAVIMPVRI